MGIGEAVPRLSDIARSAEQAELACGHRLLLGRNQIIRWQNIKGDAARDLPTRIRDIRDNMLGMDRDRRNVPGRVRHPSCL